MLPHDQQAVSSNTILFHVVLIHIAQDVSDTKQLLQAVSFYLCQKHVCDIVLPFVPHANDRQIGCQ
jgi:hypothetical protein